jgi:FAD synthetase
MSTVAGVIIGDEILTGKVRDANGPLLIDLCRDLGVCLERLVYIGDDTDIISAEVRWCSDRFDAVVTSGGVGPTHDDVTVEAVALAFGVGVDRHPDLEAMIRSWWGQRFTEAALRMADMPRGSRLLYSGDGLLPLVVCGNVYLMPGIPRLFEAKLGALRQEMKGRRPNLRSIYLSSDESRIAPLLSQVAGEFAEVKIGSYPRFDEQDHRVWITIEAQAFEAVNSAVDRLLELLSDDDIVRVE